jgi:hypothetical protein
MSDTGLSDWPPARTVTLGDARERVEDAGLTDVLEDACEEWGEDATVTVRMTTRGDTERVENALANETVGQDGAGTRRTYTAAVVCRDAPWLGADPDFPDRVAALRRLPPAVVAWIEHEVKQLQTDDEGN